MDIQTRFDWFVLMTLDDLCTGRRLAMLRHFPSVVASADYVSYVLLCFTEFLRVLPGLLGLTGFHRVILGFTQFYWILLGFYQVTTSLTMFS